MRAIVIREPGPPDVLELREVVRPEPGRHEVRVSVAASGVNRADLLERRGRYPGAPREGPAIPGLEYSGTIDEVGAGVTTWRPGDRVMGLVGGAGYAEAVVVHEREAMPIPEGVGLEEAAALPEAWLTAWDAMVVQAGLSAGEWVLVHAVGSGVGSAASQMAAALGAHVIGTSRTPSKLERARDFGVREAVLGGDVEWADHVMSATGGRGADVVIDLVGAPYLSGNLACVAERGRIVVVGVPGGREAPIDLRALMGRRASITGTVLRARPLEEKIALAQDATRRLWPLFESADLRPVVYRAFPPERAAEAHDVMERNANFGTISIVWTP
ncbi:MAG: NAD(P)H-quinone oxidoreductase [Gemmatimonadetes bacterium]|nr:NAD(P)H-quinone oxidoreductase [Gemmatimonadota bacterium]